MSSPLVLPINTDFNALMNETAETLKAELASKPELLKPVPTASAPLEEPQPTAQKFKLRVLSACAVAPNDGDVMKAVATVVRTELAIKCHQCGINEEDAERAVSRLGAIVGPQNKGPLLTLINNAIERTTSGARMCN